ncbi:hypothetical protein FLACHUCJ7_01838 [Flavobacterium chungangense]|uniref:Uncharacterized protein n=1 Tax=Flavobacterium chungangense TaxID=554283 RepID=A0A6V6YYH4_9FLAO|nr:hypothetical protein FLACHUCJ7_01838 [Flavobacterium chungangense]
MADRWKPDNPIDGTYVWLPVKITDKKPVLKWFDKWNLKRIFRKLMTKIIDLIVWLLLICFCIGRNLNKKLTKIKFMKRQNIFAIAKGNNFKVLFLHFLFNNLLSQP